MQRTMVPLRMPIIEKPAIGSDFFGTHMAFFAVTSRWLSGVVSSVFVDIGRMARVARRPIMAAGKEGLDCAHCKEK